MRYLLLVAVVLLFVFAGCKGQVETNSSEWDRIPLDELAARAGVNPIMVCETDRQWLIATIENPPPGLSAEELECALRIQRKVTKANDDSLKKELSDIAKDQKHNPCKVIGLQLPMDEPLEVGEGIAIRIESDKSFDTICFWDCSAPDVEFRFSEGKGFWPKLGQPTAIHIAPSKKVSIFLSRQNKTLPGTIHLRAVTVR